MHEKVLTESLTHRRDNGANPHQISAKMGPNGIIQTFNALKAHYGELEAKHFLQQAGLEKYIAQLPHQMVDECEFHRLVETVCETLEPHERAQILFEAGERTAEYLLQARIPKFFQVLLKHLPTRWAARLLLWAIKNMLGHLQAAAPLNTKSAARLPPKSSSKAQHIKKVHTSMAEHCRCSLHGCSNINYH
jgi:hypothetical protein